MSSVHRLMINIPLDKNKTLTSTHTQLILKLIKLNFETLVFNSK